MDIIYVGGGSSNVSIMNSNFSNSNLARAAICSSASYTNITGCNIKDISSTAGASSRPSAVYVNGAYSVLNNVNITNVKSSGNYDYNGAVHWAGSYGKISNVNFTECSSNTGKGDGGAISLTGSYTSITDCTFNKCTA